MEDVIKKLEQHDQQLEIIACTVGENAGRLDRVEVRLDGIDGRLDGIEVRLDYIAETAATKEDQNRIIQSLDQLITLAQKNDQELTVLAYNVRELNDKVEEHDKTLKLIKPVVGLI